ncbi:hypothetical protein [Micromonospora sp. NPDC005367]|uniref:hypothetical protein n=1 Tax=Micromonospora sp. NPDC005367 TaxID=3155590 RepID=UPI0033BA086B
MNESFAESALNSALRQAAHGIGVPEDPWPSFARREQRHRRIRLMWTAAVATVVAMVVGVQTNVVSLPGWAPGIAVAAAPASLLDAPPRGALTGDKAWLDTLRARLSTDSSLGGWHPDGMWKVGDRDRIRLLYGSDQPGHRVALVAVPLRIGLLTKKSLVWFVGPPGAGVEQMRYAGHSEGEDNSVMTLMRTGTGSNGLAIVVGPTDSTVTISGGPRYTPRGTVEYQNLARPDGSGVGIAVLPAEPLWSEPVVRVSRGDHVLFQSGLGGGPYAAPIGRRIEALLTEIKRGIRGAPLDDTNLRNFVETALSDSRLPVAGTTVRVRWSASVNGQDVALLTVQPAGGGVIAYAMHGDDPSWWRDLRLLLPAEGADQRPIGWRLRADNPRRTPTDKVRVVAPPDAARVTVAVGSASPITVTLDASNAGTASVPHDQPATLTAYSSDGDVLGSTPVPLVETDMSGLPGESQATRVVP